MIRLLKNVIYVINFKAKELIEKNVLDQRYYRAYYYLASIAFMEEEYDASLKYIDKLRRLSEAFMQKYYFWSKCMLYILE